MTLIKSLSVLHSLKHICFALLLLTLLAAQDPSIRDSIPRIADTRVLIDMAISLSLLSRDQAEQASASGDLDHATQLYANTSDIDLFSWQYCSSDIALPMDVNGSCFRRVAFTDHVGLDSSIVDSLYRNIASTISTIINGSPEEYLRSAHERNEALTEDTANALIRTAQKDADSSNETDSTPFNHDSGDAAFIYLWNKRSQAPYWTALSADCSQGCIVGLRGDYDDVIKRINALAYEHLLRISVDPDYREWNRIAISKRTMQSELLEHDEVVIADYLLYITIGMDTDKFVVPYLFRFWWDSSIKIWHPFQLFSTSPSIEGNFIF